VETVDEALRAVRYPNVQSVQIIFNMFRLKPAEAFFPRRRRGGRHPGPGAAGQRLLSGKLAKDSRFEANDHRQFNRQGESFDKGETFSGVPYETGLEAVERLRPLVARRRHSRPARAALDPHVRRGELRDPGAKTPVQARENAAAATLAPLREQDMAAVRALYDEKVRDWSTRAGESPRRR